MLFLVDGYNVTKSDPATSTLPLEDQRRSLAGRLAARGEGLLGRGRIVVFFDGVAGADRVERVGPVEIRYSRGDTADDAIVSAALRTSDQVTLVTSDRELAGRVRDHLGRRVAVLPRERCFEEARSEKRRRHRAGGITSEETLPSRTQERITEELENIWLTDEE